MIEAYLRANNMFVDYNEVNQPYPLYFWVLSILSRFRFLFDFALLINFSLSKTEFTHHI